MSAITIKLKLVLLTSLLFTVACSSVSDSSADAKEKKVINGNSKIYEHEHPVNPCSGAVTSHSHIYDLNEIEQHKHKYDCEATKPVISNAHTHEAIPEKGIRSYRHIHPNGHNEHTHN